MGDAVLEAEETQADFLFLRQLGQDASSVRLSDPLSLENSETSVNLICVSNTNGLLFAATNEGFIAHQLAEVRRLCSSSTRNESPRLDTPLRRVATSDNSQLGSKVNFLRIADQEQRLVVGLANGRIAIWLISDLVQNNIEKVNVMQPPSPSHFILELAPNPSDRPELCIALYGSSDRRQLQIGTAICFDVRSGQWGAELKPSNGAMTTSLAWSVRGKQVVLGLQDGSLAQMTPEGEAKDIVAKAGEVDGSAYVEQVIWLENHVFLVTYNQPPSSEEPEHQYEVYSILRDTASKTCKYVHFTDPAPPFGDTAKRGHRFTSWIKSWEPAKHMIFLANTSSTDVGLLGCLSGAAGPSSWRNLDLEDTSRPVLPFSSIDKSADTCPVGLELDFTAEDNVDDPQAANRGEDGKGKLDPAPVLYIYTNDGLLLAYTVINVDAKAGRYPGMVKPGALVQKETADETVMATDGGNQAPSSASAFTYPPSAFGQSAGSGGFGSSAPAFGQSASIGAKAASPFSFNPSASNNAAAASTPSPSASTGGFGAFAAKSSNAFGSSSPSFSFKGDTNNSTVAPAFGATSAAPPSVFGPSNALTTPTPAFGQSSAPSFASPAFGQSSTPAFGSSSAFGQSSSFGAAASQKSPFATAATNNAFSTSTSSAPSAGFGGFASKGNSSFNSSTTLAAPSSSIFGSGGNLQGSATKNIPVFGQSSASNTNTTARPAISAFGGTANVDMEEGDAGGDSGSLSFSGLDSLLGDDRKQTDNTKPAGFNFGSKQDATFSSMPTPTPFSFANNTTPKKEEVESSPSSTAKPDNTPIKSAFPSTTPSSSPIKEVATPITAFASTTPSSSPLKEETTPVRSAFAPSTGTVFPLRETNEIGAEVSGGEEEEIEDDETGDLDDGEDAEGDWEEEDDGEGELDDAEGEEGELEEGEGDSEGDSEEQEEDEGVEGEQLEAGQEGGERLVEVQEEADEDKEEALEAEEKIVEAPKGIKVEKKSPTSFNFFPTQDKAAATAEPPALALESASAPRSPVSSSTTESPQPWPLPTAEASTAPQNVAKGSTFLNFSNRAPRSSSPLSGIPLNRADLPPSPDKGLLNRVDIASPFAPKAPPPQTPATITPVQQRNSLAKEATPKLSFSNGKAEARDVEGEGLQGIFLQTFLTMERELKVLTDNVKRCSDFQELVREPNEVALSLFDLSDEAMWTFGELDTKSKLTADLTFKAEELSKETRALKFSLKEIQSQHLKVDVKREEIARFVRARNDPSFSKMVRVKQLGPEHAENQTRLRKATMSLRDGLEELEAFLEKMKRKAIEQKVGEAGVLRAPSLDTIRRTARNITQMAQIRLMELQELELSYDQMTQNKPVFMRSSNGGDTTMSGQNAFDTISSIKGTLPSVDSHTGPNGKSHFSAASAHEMQRKYLDLKSVFKSGWKEPVLTRVAKKKEVAADDYRLSDLDMAFAKGTVRVDAVKRPAPAPALAPAPAAAPATNNLPAFSATPAPAVAPSFSMPSSGFKASNAGAPSFSFNALPSTALPRDVFQLPPEQAPFSPGGGGFTSNVGRAHVSKFGGKRNTAVALPNISSSASSGSDFFAMPAAISTSPVKPSIPAFSFANASPASLSSRMGSNLTFKGLQPMKPIAQSTNTAPQEVYSDDSSEEDRPAYEQEEVLEDDEDDEYEDEEEEGEEEEDEEGLSDVVEGEEE